MARADRHLLARLSEPRTRGLRVWEYGVLLDHVGDIADDGLKTALDVGAGDSAFPRYLVSSGAVRSVTTLDLPEPIEARSPRSQALDRESGVEQLTGSMLDIPRAENSFDLVTCISAIEHLDGDPAAHRRDPEANPKLPWERYLEKTKTALREMIRVLRPGGIFYLTTEVYLPYLQRTDRWAKFDTGGVIWSAYRFEDIEPTFVDTLRQENVSFVGSPLRIDRRLLLEDPDRSTFRGRYFTTISVLARKAV